MLNRTQIDSQRLKINKEWRGKGLIAALAYASFDTLEDCSRYDVRFVLCLKGDWRPKVQEINRGTVKEVLDVETELDLVLEKNVVLNEKSSNRYFANFATAQKQLLDSQSHIGMGFAADLKIRGTGCEPAPKRMDNLVGEARTDIEDLRGFAMKQQIFVQYIGRIESRPHKWRPVLGKKTLA